MEINTLAHKGCAEEMRTNMKTKKVMGLSFGKYRHCLWVTSCKNFIKKYDSRFVLLEGKKCETGTMYFCNTYLEAIFCMKLFDGVGLYSDQYVDDDSPRYVVCSKKGR